MQRVEQELLYYLLAKHWHRDCVTEKKPCSKACILGTKLKCAQEHTQGSLMLLLYRKTHYIIRRI